MPENESEPEFTTDPESWEYSLYVPNDLRAVTVSRRTLRLILTMHGLISLVDLAELLASELVSNAVRHTKGPAALRVRWSAGVLRIGAWDADPRPPQPPRELGQLVELETEDGRGHGDGAGLRRSLGMAAAVPVREPRQIRVVRAAGRRVMHPSRELGLRPELQEEVSGIATALVAAMALVGLSPEKAMAELHGRLKEILKRDGLSPGEIAYLRGKIEKWPPGYAEQWAIGYATGLAKGKAKAILAVLEVRRLPVSDDIRERVTTCTDHARLDDWLDRVGTVERAEDLFGEGQEVPGSEPWPPGKAAD